MTPRTDLTRSLLAVVAGIPGLRPATPSTTPFGSRVPWNLDASAVAVRDDVVEIRLVALALPLPAVLSRAEAALHAVLEGTRWKDARIRLIVTDIDAGALTTADQAQRG
ncbi:hypothetical protein ABZY19_38645 [Streptomyces sp. NPDC006475]|uniref:hypothetical protein n=1 Tax=Streptomyces sp. NPDC006475 TaxID=3155719 RepID=UPI0033B5A746